MLQSHLFADQEFYKIIHLIRSIRSMFQVNAKYDGVIKNGLVALGFFCESCYTSLL